MTSFWTDRELNPSPSTVSFRIITKVIITLTSRETSGVNSDGISAGISEEIPARITESNDTKTLGGSLPDFLGE